MEQSYWLGRQRDSVKNAHRAGGAVARLAHFDLAGRYGIKAASAVLPAAEASAPPMLPQTYFANEERR